jgi:nitrogen fixation/metabolism regulation signal transduction histidine kinase
MTTGKRHLLSRGKGYLSAAGPQARFIIFLLAVLIVFTIILRVFQKLAEIVQLPVFLPVSLLTLLVFIGVVGTIYSHKFIGPLARIRKTIDCLAEGDVSISLRVRESDDPVLKDLVRSISLLCEHTRNSYALIQEASRDLSGAVTALRDELQKGSGGDEVRSRLEIVRKKQEALEQAVRSFRKS